MDDLQADMNRRQVLAGLTGAAFGMSQLFVPQAAANAPAPAGPTRLTDWLKANFETLGRSYMSEQKRRRP